jgi:YtxH-like protein
MNRKKTTNWVRFALKSALLATDVTVWDAVRRFMSERTDDVHEAFRRGDNLAERVRSQRRRSHLSTLLVGVGIGVGVGMLFAPVSGESARDALRDTASDVKNKVADVAAWAGRMRTSNVGGATSYAHD